MPAILQHMNALFWTLLLALTSLAALLDWREHRLRGQVPPWWSPVARAVLGAAIFFVLTLRFCWDWHTCQCVRFLPALVGAVLPLPQVWRGDEGRHGPSNLARAALLLGLAGVLFCRWVPLDDLAPEILDELFGVWLCPWDLHLGPSGRELTLAALELFAETALLLWLFQCLYKRLTTRRGSGGVEPNEANRPLKRRCIT